MMITTSQSIRLLLRTTADLAKAIMVLAIITALLLATHIDLSQAYENVNDIYLPLTMRSEGRITLAYTYGNDTRKTQHHLAFSESIDDLTKRSRISIGYISHDPIEYVSQEGAQLVRLDEHNNCIKSDQSNRFVPELNWFAKWLYHDDELDSFFAKYPQAVGPTGFIMMTKFLNPSLSLQYTSTTMERNIDCGLYTAKFTRRRSEEVDVEVYIPSKSYFGTARIPVFTFKERASHVAGLSDNPDSRVYNLAITIDYFNIQTQENQEAQSNKMEGDFNLPQARGCSQLLGNFSPIDWNFSSFMMTYYQSSVITHVTVAYDHEENYLRKEMFGQTISIWDLEDDILYHTNPALESETKMSADDHRQVDLKQCAILKVTDEKLGPAFMPYEKKGTSMSVDRFLGIQELTYIGMGRVRDFPTLIFETVIKSPPKIFGLDREFIMRPDHFIVQYHLINANLKKRNNSKNQSIENFWPLRVTLFAYDNSTRAYGLMDQLEVDDFHWGLMGWEKKPGELFMASECFDDEYEQVRMELSIDFNLNSDSSRKLLAHNKYRLEAELINDVFRTLEVRRIHLVEYELSLRPHNVVLTMVVGDRKRMSSLIKYPDNDVPVIEPRMDEDLIHMEGLVEQDCVSQVTLIKDAQYIVFCPFTDAGKSSCRAYTRDIGFSTTRKRGSGGPLDKCQFYRIRAEIPPPSAISTWSRWREKLRNHQFNFILETPHKDETRYAGSIQDLDITREKQLEKIFNYRLIMSPNDTEPLDSSKRNLRSFESISFDSVADCAKICNLDTHCRSYSYCATKTPSDGQSDQPKCILASLDLRASEVNQQLVRSTVLDDIRVSDVTNDQYQLALDPACNIYERDYLSMFTVTDEVVQLDESLVKQLKDEESSFDCAKSGIDLEASHPDHHVAMFAYCAYSGICLLDENLFSQLNGSSETNQVGNDDEEADRSRLHELPCNVYRRRYQSYFKLSAHILKGKKDKQVELKLNNVEECARACWNQFGHVCGSFDYCWPSSCYINTVTSSDDLVLQADDLQVRSDCLHYDRDLELDKLRAEHLVGRHNVLGFEQGSGGGLTFGRFLVHAFLFCMVSVSFVVGLVIGRQVNDRLETVTIVRQSFSAGSGGLRRVSRAFGATIARFGGGTGGPFGGSTTLSSGHRKFSTSNDLGAADDGDDSNNYGPEGLSSAIQLEEFTKSVIKEEDEDAEDNSRHEQGPNFAGTSIDLGLPTRSSQSVIGGTNDARDGLETDVGTLLEL